MNKFIVSTSIHGNTPALTKFSQMRGWQLVIVLDKKSPPDRLPGVQYLTCADQDKLDPKLSKLIGWDSIQRRNFGFLWAWKNGAEVIATVDDDNVPMEHWGYDLMVGKPGAFQVCQDHLPVFDPFTQIDNCPLWHRGYPLSLVMRRGTTSMPKEEETFTPDVQADWWQNDPDIDSICRMVHKNKWTFDAEPFPIAGNKPSPFNSQNTFLTRRVLPHYFMFPSVGRYDDILGSYHVQAKGFRVVYGAPSVVQKRNEHDVMKDFENEVWGQMNCLRIASAMQTDKRAVLAAVPERSRLAFEQYQRNFE